MTPLMTLADKIKCLSTIIFLLTIKTANYIVVYGNLKENANFHKPDCITAYCNHAALDKGEWINDSSGSWAFSTEEQAKEALASLLMNAATAVDHRTLVPAKPFVDQEEKSHELFIRVSTDEDVKERGARQRSRYYLIHGVEEDKSISSERLEARKERMERMRKSGGDGRSVFSS